MRIGLSEACQVIASSFGLSVFVYSNLSACQVRNLLEYSAIKKMEHILGMETDLNHEIFPVMWEICNFFILLLLFYGVCQHLVSVIWTAIAKSFIFIFTMTTPLGNTPWWLLLPSGSWVRISAWRLFTLSLQVLLPAWVFSWYSGFLPQAKNMRHMLICL